MNKSFTLIEILIVIVVIGTLSAFVLVGMSSITTSANITKSKAFSDSLRNSLLINLVSEWKLDNSKTDGEVADTASIIDTFGNSNALNVNGTPIVRSGNNCISGNCLDIINSTDYVSLTNPASIYNQIINNSAYTIEGWGYFRNLTGVPAGGILKSYSSGDNAWFIFIYRNTGDTANLVRSWVAYTNISNVSGNLSVTTTIQTNKWYYFVTTASLVGTTGTNKLYVNSVGLNPVSNSSVSKLYSRDATTAVPLCFSGWAGVDFKIDEIRFYNRVIPTSRIRQNYYLGLNKLLKNQNITSEEFNERISELKFNLSNNE